MPLVSMSGAAQVSGVAPVALPSAAMAKSPLERAGARARSTPARSRDDKSIEALARSSSAKNPSPSCMPSSLAVRPASQPAMTRRRSSARMSALLSLLLLLDDGLGHRLRERAGAHDPRLGALVVGTILQHA